MKPKLEFIYVAVRPDDLKIRENGQLRDVGRRKAQRMLFDYVAAGDVVHTSHERIDGYKCVCIAVFDKTEMKQLMEASDANGR